MNNLIKDFPEITDENKHRVFEILQEITLGYVENDKTIPEHMATAVKNELSAEIASSPEMRMQIIASFERALMKTYESIEKVENIRIQESMLEQYIKTFDIMMHLADAHLVLQEQGK